MAKVKCAVRQGELDNKIFESLRLKSLNETHRKFVTQSLLGSAEKAVHVLAQLE